MSHLSIIDVAWKNLEQIVEAFEKNGVEVAFDFHDSQKKDLFEKKFIHLCNYIRETFMSPNTETLDSHKQAAALVISAIECKLVAPKNKDNSMLLYNTALGLGILYLQNRMNEQLHNLKLIDKNTEIKISFPTAFACDTPYFSIMTRLLYYEDSSKEQGEDLKPYLNYDGSTLKYNILEMSDRFFLLEYITLLENHINPLKLAIKE